MLKVGGDILAVQARHILPHVATEDLIEWSGLLGVIVDVLRNLP